MMLATLNGAGMGQREWDQWALDGRKSAVSIRDGAQTRRSAKRNPWTCTEYLQAARVPVRAGPSSQAPERQLTSRKSEQTRSPLALSQQKTRTLQTSAVAAHPSALIGPGPRLMQAACGRLVSHVRTPGRHRISGLVAVLHCTGPTGAHPAATPGSLPGANGRPGTAWRAARSCCRDWGSTLEIRGSRLATLPRGPAWWTWRDVNVDVGVHLSWGGRGQASMITRPDNGH